MSSNDKQIGGKHYAAGLQHWDFVLAANLDYFPAQITRYITRARKKNGVEDLQKALHYTEKFIEVEKARQLTMRKLLDAFVRDNKLDAREAAITSHVTQYTLGDTNLLSLVKLNIEDLIYRHNSAGVPNAVSTDPVFLEDADEWRR